jgi:hypothetical protein
MEEGQVVFSRAEAKKRHAVMHMGEHILGGIV